MTYNEFIQNIIETRGQWNIPDGEYYEKHHIIPKCLGGMGDKKDGSFYNKSKNKNCIWLYPEEHFTAHRLLYEENKDDIHIIRAYWMICRWLYKKGDISEENYCKVKTEWYNKTAKARKSEEHKNKIGMSNKGNKRPDLSEYNSKFKKGSKDSYNTHIKKCIAQTGAKIITVKRLEI